MTTPNRDRPRSAAPSTTPNAAPSTAPNSAGPPNGAPPQAGEARAQRGEAERSHDSWTILSLLRWTTDHFAAKGIESARLDAECLLAYALDTERLQLYLDFEKPVSEPERARFRELVRRRGADRVPVAQLLGRKEFWSLSLEVGPEVLTPRPDTETLVQAGLDLLAHGESRVLDLGTGSGCVALAIASERPGAGVVATDISEAALAVASRNAEALGLADRVAFRCGSLFEPVAAERFDLIVSNPPYVAETLRPELPPELAHEPPEALFGGPDGGDLLRKLAAGAGARLAPGGAFAVELAPDQAEPMLGWCREAGLLDVTLRRDLEGRPRVVTARGGD